MLKMIMDKRGNDNYKDLNRKILREVFKDMSHENAKSFIMWATCRIT